MQIFFLNFYFVATPHSMWNLSSLTRDQTHAPALKAQSLNHGTAREVPKYGFVVVVVV